MKENKLRRVIFSLNEEWEKEELDFRERLTREGILSIDFAKTDGSLTLIKKNEDAVVLTDSPQTGAELAHEGIVYFGCCHAQNVWETQTSARELTGVDADTDAGTNVGSGWFDGAVLVLEGFEEIDAEYLEEWMLRAKGQPVTIAKTGRLLIREIADEDIPELERIGRECGEAEAQGSRFTKEYLHAYRRTAYRLQGFGLWSVLYRDRVIGCCGFEPWDTGLEPAESAASRIVLERKIVILYHINFREPLGGASGSILEMQYMLDPAYHRQGFGTEMCRAALAYARERLDANEVRLRIRESNLASRALAEKLGFVPKLQAECGEETVS